MERTFIRIDGAPILLIDNNESVIDGKEVEEEIPLNELVDDPAMKKGIKIFGEAEVRSIYKEMKHCHDREVVRPLKLCDVTYEIKRKALAYRMFLKMKINWEIKAQGCADGQPQRVYKSKEEKYSPLVALESIFITSDMAAKEGRDVANVDILGGLYSPMLVMTPYLNYRVKSSSCY